jgi:pseudouridine kinase
MPVSVYVPSDESPPNVLVVGAMAADAKGQPHQTLTPGRSTPGAVHFAIGGVGRNIAETLARLGVQTTLLSAVGDDPIGRILLEATARSGVDTTYVVTSARHRTAGYIAVLDRHGSPAYAIDDMAVIEEITPGLVYRHRRLIRDADMIVLDANLGPRTISSILDLAKKYDCPVCVDPTSAVLAPRFVPHLSDILLMTPNAGEAEALTGLDLDETDAHNLAAVLVGHGVEIAIITLAELGLYYVTSDESGRVPALSRDVVDLTGAGAALAGGVIFGLLNGFEIGEAMRLGVSAAALAIQVPETVHPGLSLDRLYDELVI